MDLLQPGRYNPQQKSHSTTPTNILNSHQDTHSMLDHQAQQSDWKGIGADPSAAGLSPLESLMLRGRQFQEDISLRVGHSPSALSKGDGPGASSSSPSGSRIYERATALSRSTSIKRNHRAEPSPEMESEAHWDDAQSIRSIDLHGSASPFSSRSARQQLQQHSQTPESTSIISSRRLVQQPSHEDGYADDSFPRRFDGHLSPDPQHRARESSHLLNGAFRSSIASDISFNSITNEDDRYSIAGGFDPFRGSGLARRESIDTVRSSEFGHDGRWGRAWADKPEDEESVYGEEDEEGGAHKWYASDRPESAQENLVIQGELNIDPTRGLGGLSGLGQGRGLDSLAQQWKTRSLEERAVGKDKRSTIGASRKGSTSPLPQIQSVPIKEHVVNLTRSSQIPEYVPRNSIAPESPSDDHSRGPQAPPTVPSLSEAPDPSVDQRQVLGHRVNDSTSTLGSGGAHVYVYPPSPSSSDRSRSSAGGGDSSQARSRREHVVGQASKAVVETLIDSPPQNKDQLYGHAMQEHHNRQKATIPAAPSDLLARPLDSPIIGRPGGKSKASGHPAGRPPPPTPAEGNFAFERQAQPGYRDPNEPGTGLADVRPSLGKTRAKAIAAQNGRESMVSDLDVETLRLDGSSRRDSASTIASSRMSVGTVKYDEIGLNENLRVSKENLGERPRSSFDSEYSQSSDFSQTSITNPNWASIANSAPRMASQQQQQNGNQAAWNHSTRLRPMDLPEPRRSVTEPMGAAATNSSADGKQSVKLGQRSFTHPQQTNLWPAKESQWAKGGQEHSQPTRPPLQQSLSQQSTDSSLRTSKSGVTIRSAPGQIQGGQGSQSSGGTLSSASSIAPSSIATKPPPKGGVSRDTRTGPSTAEDFLSQGITYHEQGDLSRSAYYFERSAKVEGGCVVGMCMFGMALREGWGARKDPKKGFEWIQRAASRAGDMMKNGEPKSESEIKAIKSELKLSVYELAKCFCYGWGVKMDKPMALEYFELAAKLGDADAQAEAGALYASGKGCKKDLKKAAMYYRMAEEGGYDTVGLSWIHKDKYK